MSQRNKGSTDILLAKAQQDEDVLAVFVFGSVARGEEVDTSDIDVCLFLMPQSTHLDPAGYSHKRLDYIVGSDFDVQIFQQLPLPIRRRVLREGQILFVRDEDLLYELAIRTAKAFEDFKYIYYHYLDEVANAGS